jgi:predicted DNA-binding transcriptional regulator AlpA
MNTTTNDSTIPILVSIPTAAQHLNISVRGVYRLFASGDLPRPIKVGGSTKFFDHQLRAYMDALATSVLNA